MDLRFPTCHLPLIAVLLGAWCPVRAADHHVAAGGSDDAAGTLAAPFATVAHAISRSTSGDRILLRRGDTFPEAGLSLQSGRTLAAYGTGPRPVLSGAATLGDWQPVAGRAGRFQTSAAGCHHLWGPQGLLPRARFPDSAWLRTAAGTTGDRLQVPDLSDSAGTWTGAVVRWRRWSWWYETRSVSTDHGSGDLELAARPFSAPDSVGIGSGLYLEAERALDAAGEWWFAAGVLTLQSPDGAVPRAGSCAAVQADRAISLAAGATMQGIAIRHYVGDGGAVRITGPASISDCVIERISRTGIVGVWNAGGSTIDSCRFSDILNNAIAWNENPDGSGGTVIRDNAFRRIGMAPGQGGSGSWHASGVVVSNGNESGAGVHIQRNRFSDIGYCGVILGSDGQRVEHNVFERCLSTLNDGAAIYTNSHGNLIHENLIFASLGDTFSGQPWTPLGHGIWPEFLSDFRDHQITGNTVYGCAGHGLFLPNNFTATVTDNIFLSNRKAGIDLSGRGDQAGDLQQDNTLTGNICGIGARPYAPSRPENLADWNQYSDFARCLSYQLPDAAKGRGDYDHGRLGGTVLVRPTAGVAWITAGNSSKTIPTWQLEEADWADPAPATVTAPVHLFANDTAQAVDWSLPPGDWQTLAGEPIGGSVALAAWRSTALVLAAGDGTALPGYFLASRQGRAISIRSDGGESWHLGTGSGPITQPATSVDQDDTHRFEHLDPAEDHRLKPSGTAPSDPG